MDPRLLHYYNRELTHIREVGGEFAAEFPKIAARLGLSGFECADPYVERLLEGFAFLAARVQLKIDDEFPAFTRHLLDMVYPHYLAPTPSMTVVQLAPDPREGSLAEGYEVPRGSVLRGSIGPGEQTACQYRTAHQTVLWPLRIAEAEYFSHTGPVARSDLAALKQSKAGIRLRLQCTGDLTFDQLAPGSPERFRPVLFLRGADQFPFDLYARLLGNASAVLIQPTRRPVPFIEVLPPAVLQPLGFDDTEALLPYAPPSFQGYRNLHEYFAFPERYLFVEVRGLGAVLPRIAEGELDLIVLLSEPAPELAAVLDRDNFALHCTPAINLFPLRFDRIHLDDLNAEHHVLPDRTRPLDFEVYAVERVTGYGTASAEERSFQPFYAPPAPGTPDAEAAYFSVHRVPRRLSRRQRRDGPRSSYIGSEVFINLVDADAAPWSQRLRQLAVSGLCTNRDLPLQLPVGVGDSDFTLDIGAPVLSVRVVAGPTPPRPSHAHGDTAWRLISHLALNYLSIADSEGGRGVSALRDLLSLYAHLSEPQTRRQIEGVTDVATRRITRRLPGVRPISYARGIEITISCDESAFEGTGAFLLAAVLERFFARYCSINGFTETVLRGSAGTDMRWPARLGRRPVL